MSMTHSPEQIHLGLLPEPEGRSASFVVSAMVNSFILAVCLVAGMMAKTVIQQRFEETQIVFSNSPPPPPRVKKSEPIKITQPTPVVREALKMEAPKIQVQRAQPRPEAVKMEAKLSVPDMQIARPKVILQPQPKAAMTAAMPAQEPQVRMSTRPVHFGSLFGVTPNPDANRPATVAAIGNPYGRSTDPAAASHGVVGSAGIGNGLRGGSNAGALGRVASAGIPGTTPTVVAARQTATEPRSTALEVLSKPPVRYTPEAKQLKVQGDVVLRVTFLADGQVVVQKIVSGLGHGLDQEAAREAQQISFRPATRDGRPVDLTTEIIITFQLA